MSFSFPKLKSIFQTKFNHPNPPTFDSIRRQYFSLPSTLIYYLSKNPISAVGHQKLQKTSKYFFAKNKIVVVKSFCTCYDSKKSLLCYYCDYQKLYFKNFQNLKLWLTGKMVVCEGRITEILKIVYRCTIKLLVIEHKNLTLDELNFMLNGGKLQILSLDFVNICDSHGALVSCDKILAKVPNILNFDYLCESETFTSETFERMNALKFNTKLEKIVIAIYNISSDADITLLCDFVKKNAAEGADVIYYMKMNNLEVYRSTLRAAAIKLIHSWKTGKNPDIWIS